MTEQLAAKKVIIGEGRVAIIDATVVEAARTGRGKLGEGETDGRDPEAGAHVKINARGRKVGTWGYQFQVNADEDGFIHAQTVTPGNAHEIKSWKGLMTGGETELYADCAYSAQETRDTLAARGVADRVQRKGYRNAPLLAAEVARNKEIGVTRAGVERIFGHGKQVWRLRAPASSGWRATGPTSPWSPSPGTSGRAGASSGSMASARPESPTRHQFRSRPPKNLEARPTRSQLQSSSNDPRPPVRP